MVSSGDVEEAKPAPDICQVTLGRAGCAPEDAVMVGDTAWDVIAAKGAGLRAVTDLTGGASSRAELRDAGAVAVYADCAAMLEAGLPDHL